MSLFRLSAQSYPTYSFQTFTPDISTRILINREHSNYSLWQQDTQTLCEFIQDLEGPEFHFQIQLGEQIIGLSLMSTAETSPYSTCNTYHYTGIMNQDSGSMAELWFYNEQIYLHLEDSVTCLRLHPTLGELVLPDVQLFESLPCVHVDPGVEPFNHEPVDCDINLEVVIFADPDFITSRGSLIEAERYVDEVLNGPDGVANHFRRYIREFQGKGTFSFNYILENPDGSPKLFVLDKFYDPKNSASKIEKIYTDDFPCLPKDMYIYFHSGTTSVTSRAHLLQCNSSGLNSPIMVSLGKSPTIDRLIETATHEFGHYFTAPHLSVDPLQPCLCIDGTGKQYIMCSPPNGFDMHECSWQAISQEMNALCACLSDTHAPPCENCLGLYSNLELSNNKLSDVVCNNGSETDVTITIHNDCTPRNFTYVKVAYSKGAQSSHDKLEIIDPMDFTG